MSVEPGSGAAPTTNDEDPSHLYDLMKPEADYPTWEGPPRRSVVVCSHLRSGSTLLGEAIHQAGGAGMPLEYFHLGFRPRFQTRWRSRTLDDYVADVHRFRTDPTGAFGVKFFWRDLEEMAHERDRSDGEVPRPPPSQMDAADYRRLYAKIETAIPNPIFVHLRRQDRVRQAVSARKANLTGHWRAIDGAPVPQPKEQASYDYDRIASFVAWARNSHAHWSALFRAIGVAPYELTYEQLSADFPTAVGGVLEWIGATSKSVRPPRMRRQSDSASEAMALRFLKDEALRNAGRDRV